MSYSGFTNAALQMGFESIVIKPERRGIYNAKYADPSTPGATIAMPDIKAMATVRERHMDQLEITDHPVEQGASISDHAFKRPAEVTIEIAWSLSPNNAAGTSGLINSAVAAGAANNKIVKTGAAIYGAVQAIQGVQSALAGVEVLKKAYDTLLELQSQKALFDVYTSKRTYLNMVCKTLSTETDYTTANALIITMVCHQVILVNTQTVAIPKSTAKNPEKFATPIQKGQSSAIPSNAMGK